MTLGEQFKQLRAKKGLSQPELAELAGIEQSYLSKLENDKSLPSNDVFRKMISAFSMTIEQVLQPLEQGYIKQNLLAISDVEQHYKERNIAQVNKQRTLLYSASFLIVIAVTLFYIGFSKQVFNEAVYEYKSRGVVLAGEPDNIFTNWRQLLDNSDRRSFGEQRQKQEINMAKRSDVQYLQTGEDRGTSFEMPVTGGRRLFTRVVFGENNEPSKQVPRAINAWLQVIGVLLFISGIMGFVIERRLFNNKL